jgi:hypothetical protein
MEREKVCAALAVLGIALSSCVVAAVPACGPGLVDCGGYCADLNADETDCGACQAACPIGDFCGRGLCIVGSCLADDSACGFDSDCCSNYCASDGACGCIPTGRSGCLSPSDCCSGRCARDGVCDP